MKTEHNNFEKQLQKRLEQHSINPSENAWHKLEALLDDAEGKQKKQSGTWWYVAASIVAVLGTFSLYFTSDATREEQMVPVVVEQQTAADTIATEVPTIPQNKRNSVIKPNLMPLKSAQNNLVVTTKKEQEEQSKAHKNLNVEENKVTTPSQPIIKNEVAIAEEKTFDKISVNATSLLESVENSSSTTKPAFKSNSYAIDYTFKEKMLKKLEKNYKSAKTAIVNRNTE